MEIPTISACINKISDTIARLPVKLYRRDDGKISEIQGDKRLDLLNGETGDTLNTVDLWKAVVEDYFLGNGAWIYLNFDGIQLKSIHYVDSRNISIMTNTDPIFKAFDVFVNGKKYYDFQFIRLFRKTRNGYGNIPLQHENQRILAVAYNALKVEEKMNKKGGNKPGFLKAKTKLSKEALETAKASCNALYDVDGNGVSILNDGLDFQAISSTAVEMQINENKKANSIELSKIFGFPHTIIDGGASDEDNKQFISAVTAILNQIETALDMAMLLEKEKQQGYYFAFDTKELTRGSIKERFEAYEIAIRNHILQVDEIRREEDYEALGFNWVTMGLGDVLLNPKTMEIFTPNTNQLASLNPENRAEMELRFNHNHDSRGRFASGGGGGAPAPKNSEKVLTFGENSGIIKEKSEKPITPITDKTIEKVQNVEIEGYTAEQCAEIQKQHKELLDYSRKNNDNKEVAFVFDSSLKNRQEFFGTDDQLDFSNNLYGKDLVIMHNHPRNSSYSITDIEFFASNSNVKTLTIVKNNGKIEYLTKTENFDANHFKMEYNRLKKKVIKQNTDFEKDLFVKKLLSAAKEGVNWSGKK